MLKFNVFLKKKKKLLNITIKINSFTKYLKRKNIYAGYKFCNLRKLKEKSYSKCVLFFICIEKKKHRKLLEGKMYFRKLYLTLITGCFIS